MQTVLGLFTAVLLVIVVAGLTIGALQRQRSEMSSVFHTREVLLALAGTRSALQGAETGQRGYLLTFNTDYLTPFRGAAAAVDADARRLALLTQDNPSQQIRVHRLKELADAKLAELQETIDLCATRGQAAALAVVLSGRGRRLMDESRVEMNEIEAAERRLLKMRSARTETAVNASLVVVLAGSLVLLLIIGSNTISIGRDILVREKLEESLFQSEQRASMMLKSIGDAVVATDEKGKITFMNPVAQELTGWSESEAKGRDSEEVFCIFNETTRAEAQSPIRRVIREGVIVGLANHTVLICKDGAERNIDDSGAPIRDRSGNLIGVILIFRDITEQRNQERRLDEAQALTEDLNARLQRSMTETHHRVKNSLQMVTALIDLEFDEPGGLEQLKGQIRALAVVHDILTTQMKQDAAAPGISVSHLLTRLMETIKFIAGPRMLNYKLDDALIESRTASAVALVANELVLNSLKHADKAIDLTFTVEGPKACLQVQDEGPGIAEDFDIDASANIGLELIASLVRNDLRGEVQFENRTDCPGARVTVRFPVLAPRTDNG